VTRRAERGRQTPLVVARERGGGRPIRRLRLPGAVSVPPVAYDASAGGLSAGGRTLVLISPRWSFPRTGTTLAVLDAKRLTTCARAASSRSRWSTRARRPSR